MITQAGLSWIELFPGPSSRPPSAVQIIALAEIYQTTPRRLLAPEALDRLPAAEREIVIRCDPGHAAVPGDHVSEAAPEPQPQPLIPSSIVPPLRRPVGGLQPEVEMAARRARRFVANTEASNVGPGTLDQLRDEIVRIARAYPQDPLPTLLFDLIECQDIAFRLLEGHQRPAESAELYLLAGVASGMLAKASHDMGDPHTALTQARASFVCADNAGHDGLRAWTRGLQSLIAYWAGWPSDAARYATTGAGFATRTQGSASVWLPAQEARAWAIIGDRERAVEAIDRAQAARESVGHDELDDFGGIMTFNRPRQLYYAADTLVWLPGDEQRADQTAQEALSAYDGADPGDRAFGDEAGARADQSLARVHTGDLDGAAEALRPVLDLPADQRNAGIVASAMRVHNALRVPAYARTPQARDLREEIEQYSQVSVRTALSRGR
ncbi:hypothetical protein [Spongiactinospora sp. 9N601]|uniref:hypothetical protein n=1 Tax=Spongiactinospora sp. 9N601 TaxID=3375149 RepID=UPI0037BCAA23